MDNASNGAVVMCDPFPEQPATEVSHDAIEVTAPLENSADDVTARAT